jgi:hypothetical protein
MGASGVEVVVPVEDDPIQDERVRVDVVDGAVLRVDGAVLCGDGVEEVEGVLVRRIGPSRRHSSSLLGRPPLQEWMESSAASVAPWGSLWKVASWCILKPNCGPTKPN